MTKGRTRTKNRLRKRTKTRSYRGGTYESFTPSDLKKTDKITDVGSSDIKYEKFNKHMLTNAQGERRELDNDYAKWRQDESTRIDTEIDNLQREIDNLKIEKRELRCTRKNMFGFGGR